MLFGTKFLFSHSQLYSSLFHVKSLTFFSTEPQIMNSLIKSVRLLSISKEFIAPTGLKVASSFHSSAALDTKYNSRNHGPTKWLQHNKTVFPPQEPHEEPRKAVSFFSTISLNTFLCKNF